MLTSDPQGGRNLHIGTTRQLWLKPSKTGRSGSGCRGPGKHGRCGPMAGQPIGPSWPEVQPESDESLCCRKAPLGRAIAAVLSGSPERQKTHIISGEGNVGGLVRRSSSGPVHAGGFTTPAHEKWALSTCPLSPMIGTCWPLKARELYNTIKRYVETGHSDCPCWGSGSGRMGCRCGPRADWHRQHASQARPDQ